MPVPVKTAFKILAIFGAFFSFAYNFTFPAFVFFIGVLSFSAGILAAAFSAAAIPKIPGFRKKFYKPIAANTGAISRLRPRSAASFIAGSVAGFAAEASLSYSRFRFSLIASLFNIAFSEEGEPLKKKSRK